MKIGWLQVSSRKYGGVIYEEKVKEILSQNFDLEIMTIDSKRFKKGYLRAPEIFFGLLGIKGEKDLWIRDNKTIALLLFSRTQGKNLAIIHHIDYSQTQFIFKPLDFILEKLVYLGLKKADVIVAVSQYWQEYLLRKGYKNVFKVCNCFDVSQYEKIQNEENSEFKKRYGLEGRPIVYLGNSQKIKGVIETCEALKDLDVHLVTSGEKMTDIPAKNLKIEYSDYLRLLKNSDLSVFMPRIKEGWGRIAHESLLLKTPVIGSGKGGMEELLKGGNQIICKDFKELREKVEYLLNHPEERKRLGNLGYEFAKEFTFEKFKEQWLDIINNI